ncbi:hypothetical protein JAAARDRAFT_48552 [Jaapia argillacea MUCL 33604]|uniref:Uncharacterized protein n=1 Tax=Jaapia argillacea MUCL 33604 TaxID=933084 RepID=A0A067PZ63_9AGAM|nr:hypothetical protein JAAARDRAFT_48552 [Jaapia argillacea MUCL 33604]
MSRERRESNEFENPIQPKAVKVNLKEPPSNCPDEVWLPGVVRTVVDGLFVEVPTAALPVVVSTSQMEPCHQMASSLETAAFVPVSAGRRKRNVKGKVPENSHWNCRAQGENPALAVAKTGEEAGEGLEEDGAENGGEQLMKTNWEKGIDDGGATVDDTPALRFRMGTASNTSEFEGEGGNTRRIVAK